MPTGDENPPTPKPVNIKTPVLVFLASGDVSASNSLAFRGGTQTSFDCDPIDAILAVLTPPTWKIAAACTCVDPAVFYRQRSFHHGSKEVCRSCFVQNCCFAPLPIRPMLATTSAVTGNLAAWCREVDWDAWRAFVSVEWRPQGADPPGS
jgi:hypothetical protein